MDTYFGHLMLIYSLLAKDLFDLAHHLLTHVALWRWRHVAELVNAVHSTICHLLQGSTQQDTTLIVTNQVQCLKGGREIIGSLPLLEVLVHI